MKTLSWHGAALLAAVLVVGPAAWAEGPEITYPPAAAESGLQDSHRQQIDAYVKYWIDALVTADATDRIVSVRRRFLDGYNQYGSKAGEHQDAYAKSVADHGKALLSGKLAADDALAPLKEVNFAISVRMMSQVSLQPLAEVMITHKNPAVRWFGWNAYAMLRSPVLAFGGRPVRTMYAAMEKALAAETDPHVLSEAMVAFRMSPKPAPGQGVTPEVHSETQEEFLKILGKNWTSLCRKVIAVDGTTSEAASSAVGSLTLIKAGLGDSADTKALLQMALNMAYAGGMAYDRAGQMQAAAQAAQQAVGADVEAEGAGADADALAAAKKLAAQLGKKLEDVARMKGDFEQVFAANTTLLTSCERALNAFAGRGDPGDQYIRKPLNSRAAVGARGAAVRLGILKWVDELKKSHKLKDPTEMLRAPATAPAATAPAKAP